jgi:hypothetical protein
MHHDHLALRRNVQVARTAACNDDHRKAALIGANGAQPLPCRRAKLGRALPEGFPFHAERVPVVRHSTLRIKDECMSASTPAAIRAMTP